MINPSSIHRKEPLAAHLPPQIEHNYIGNQRDTDDCLNGTQSPTCPILSILNRRGERRERGGFIVTVMLSCVSSSLCSMRCTTAQTPACLSSSCSWVSFDPKTIFRLKKTSHYVVKAGSCIPYMPLKDNSKRSELTLHRPSTYRHITATRQTHRAKLDEVKSLFIQLITVQHSPF